MALFGPAWPLKRGREDTYDLYTDIRSQINFYLTNLLLTSPGENISDPSYGVGLRQFLFEMNNQFTRSEINSRITEQILFYVRTIELVDVQVMSDADQIDDYTLTVKISYRLEGALEQFELNIDNPKEIGFY
mgnify:CR=1 FL=1|tara:strand:- start:962 stop:1357 length:396 start_codon:yes stop_codon:yes gene_type:complete